MASSPAQFFLFVAFALLAIAAHHVDAWGGRLFFSKMTRPEGVEPDKAATDTTVLPEAFSRPSTSGRSNRGYGLYGRPEENYPPAYFHRGVHRDAEKLTTTEYNVPTPASEEAAPAAPVEEYQSSRERTKPSSFPENGSGRGRPLSYARTRGQRQNYGMSDTRLYENGRYYYDVETDKYGYGDESNPVRTRPEEFGFGGADRRGRYGANEAGSGNEFGNGVVEKQNGFDENQNEQYIP